MPDETKPTLATLVLQPPASGQLPLIAADQLFRQGNTLLMLSAQQLATVRSKVKNQEDEEHAAARGMPALADGQRQQ